MTVLLLWVVARAFYTDAGSTLHVPEAGEYTYTSKIPDGDTLFTWSGVLLIREPTTNQFTYSWSVPGFVDTLPQQAFYHPDAGWTFGALAGHRRLSHRIFREDTAVQCVVGIVNEDTRRVGVGTCSISRP